RYDTNTGIVQTISLGYMSCGVGIDNNGYVWVSNHSETSVQKISPDGLTVTGPYFVGNQGNSRGVAVTPADNSVWVANEGLGSVWGLNDNGVMHSTPPVGMQPIGVSVDAAGKVWTVNRGSHTATRVDPATASVDLTVDLGADADPFCMGDMTGMVAMNATTHQGSWTVVQDGGEAGTAWDSITWNTEPEGSVPAGASIVVTARAAETQAGLSSEAFVAVTSGAALSLTGQFIEVQATLKAADDGTSPVLSDLTIRTPEDEPPVADANGPYTVAEGSTVTLDGSGSTDPNQDPATLTYEWDLDGDGEFGETGPDAARGDEVGIQPTYSAAGLDGPDSKTVALKVTNDVGLSDTSTAAVEVTNVAPTAVDDGYATDPADMFDVLDVSAADGVLVNDTDPAGANDPLTVTSTGGLTTALGATVVMNADGSFSYDATTSGALLGLGDGETAADSFSYEISDGDGGTAGATVTVTVTGTGENSIHIIDSPCGDGTNALVVRGSSLDDKIDVKIGALAGWFEVDMKTPAGRFQFEASSDVVNKVIVYGLDGDDDIKVHSELDVPGWLFGGAGDDQLRGGKADDMLVGGDGDDMLSGMQGRDLLIGGLGADRIVGTAAEDILVAGATSYDNNLVALCALMAEWTSSSDFATRVAHIMGPVGGLNGSYFLNADPANGPVTVFCDDAQDKLTGGGGADWFLANLNGDGVLDKITDLRPGDVFSETDLEWLESDPLE
ncbi:MAG: Ig-like domain-containing protein, partial [Phycisphaerae bacterium]